MSEDYYMVIMNGELIAERMSLTYALVLVRALMREYYAEPSIFVTVQREKDSRGVCEVSE